MRLQNFSLTMRSLLPNLRLCTLKRSELSRLPEFLDATEIAALVAAASTISSDSSTIKDPEFSGGTIDRFSCDDSLRPDVQYEQADAIFTMYQAVETLTLLEKKLLIMKGLTINI